MPSADPASSGPRQAAAPAGPDEAYQQVMNAFGRVVERITPWLFDVGSWIFGGFIAFDLLIIASLLTMGPVDAAIEVSTTAFALALPLNVSGLVLLRLVQDLKRVRIEAELAEAFQESGLAVAGEIASSATVEALGKRRARLVLRYCLGILVLCALLTQIGIVAALWHMGWWIGVAFIAAVLVGLALVLLATAAALNPGAKATDYERLYQAALARQAKQENAQNGH